jgi:hypothetical protein
MRDVAQSLAVLGVAQVATEELLAAQLGLRTLEQIRENCRKSVYWPEFCQAAKAGQVSADWLPGALGRVVLAWAKAYGEAVAMTS